MKKCLVFLVTFLSFLFAHSTFPVENKIFKKENKPKGVDLEGLTITDNELRPNDDIQSFILRKNGGKFNDTLYRKILGAANPYKEGDEIMNLHAHDEKSRENARKLVGNTPIALFYDHPVFEDNLQKFIWEKIDKKIYETIKDWTLNDLKHFLLNPAKSEQEIKKILPGLNPHAIGALTKIMTNHELGDIGKKIFFTQEKSQIGSPHYFGARVQPNSPTDNPDDIAWQVFDAWSYAVGDVMLGTNPVDSQVESVATIEERLKDIIQTFEQEYHIENLLPWVVLAHIDVQKEVEEKYPGLTSLWFQSLAGTESANKTFDLTIDKMVGYAKNRPGPYSFYFETGQGADFTNGHGHGFDMVLHEANKYAFARVLNEIAAENRPGADKGKLPFMVVNDVAGFIGPEVYQTKEQLLRTTLEDIAMGKLSGITIGLDICSTLHMSVSLDDLEWVQNEILTLSSPAYAMALPTRNDPMLSYLTTSFQDHVRLRTRFGTHLNDKMWTFFQRLKIIDREGKPTEHFGDPRWVYYLYREAKGDMRPQKEIYDEAYEQMLQVESRGVPLATGHGKEIYDLNPKLDQKIRDLYQDAKESLWTEWNENFLKDLGHLFPVVHVESQSVDRKDYIYHPFSGEKLSPESVVTLQNLVQRRTREKKKVDLQIVISDGLNSKALMDPHHLLPYLNELKKLLADTGLTLAEDLIIAHHGRVRLGYEIGHILFANEGINPIPSHSHKGILHIIGERPGSGHHNYSVYIAFPPKEIWNLEKTLGKKVDHDRVKLVSGISDTALNPKQAAENTLTYLKELGGL